MTLVIDHYKLKQTGSIHSFIHSLPLIPLGVTGAWGSTLSQHVEGKDKSKEEDQELSCPQFQVACLIDDGALVDLAMDEEFTLLDCLLPSGTEAHLTFPWHKHVKHVICVTTSQNFLWDSQTQTACV